MREEFSVTLEGGEVRQLIYRFSDGDIPDGWYVSHDGVQYRIESDTFVRPVVAVDDPERMRSLPHRLASASELRRFSVPRVDAGGVVVQEPPTSNERLSAAARRLPNEVQMFLRGTEGV